MKRLNVISLLAFTGFLGASPLYGNPSNSAAEGTIQVTIYDENGTLAQEAPVYIYGEKKTHFVGGRDVSGTTTFSMKAGVYRISSAMIKKTDDYVDRFASNEAHIEVLPGDNVSVILTLKPLANTEIPQLSYATLRTMGVPVNLANN